MLSMAVLLRNLRTGRRTMYRLRHPVREIDADIVPRSEGSYAYRATCLNPCLFRGHVRKPCISRVNPQRQTCIKFLELTVVMKRAFFVQEKHRWDRLPLNGMDVGFSETACCRSFTDRLTLRNAKICSTLHLFHQDRVTKSSLTNAVFV